MRINRLGLIVLMIVASFSLFAGSGCKSSEEATPTSNINNAIVGVGSTFVDPLMKRWIIAFQNQNPHITVNYRAEGSGAGIEQVRNGMSGFAASDAPVADAELTNMPALLQLPVTAGPVCIIYNLPQFKKDLRLNGRTLSDIFLGKIVQWNDPAIARDNPGAELPHVAILVVHRADGSGTTSILTNFLSKTSPDWQKRVGAGLSVQWPVGLDGKGSTGVIDLVKRGQGAIGYAELNYAKQEDLSVASIQNRAGTYVEPGVEGATAALNAFDSELAKDARTPIVDPPSSAKDAYPISGVTFVLVPKDGTNEIDRKTVRNFVNYAVTDGQAATEGLYYAKLPKALQAQDVQLLAEMTVNGQPLK